MFHAVFSDWHTANVETVMLIAVSLILCAGPILCDPMQVNEIFINSTIINDGNYY